ncbi:GNAT family N-acetyltransferase [Pseudoflavitalea sp. G-6-1-2]|uniref:GNAT family N-acetyltransferase n=1 Tax=Pseudoflavitalea sp. G-6-1-2 TaxID=2728841 RepID=UPI00146A4EBB|nr:GNAT family N-acetyltransferase [Pseudoflavitalea sp. G-6-1-2]NML23126.1 GNAT family N-acetyltransferase [Pseudoflavitalea sp. G-6-1-2]
MRPFDISDKDPLTAIFLKNTPQYFDPEEVHDFHLYLSQHGDTYFTIIHDGNIVGGAGYYINSADNSGRITWIFFDPQTAGQGLGRKAVEHFISIFNTQPGIEKLVVTTSQLAWKFFQKFGYVLVRTEKDHWGKGLDLYLMERPNLL